MQAPGHDRHVLRVRHKPRLSTRRWAGKAAHAVRGLQACAQRGGATEGGPARRELRLGPHLLPLRTLRGPETCRPSADAGGDQGPGVPGHEGRPGARLHARGRCRSRPVRAGGEGLRRRLQRLLRRTRHDGATHPHRGRDHGPERPDPARRKAACSVRSALHRRGQPPAPRGDRMGAGFRPGVRPA